MFCDVSHLTVFCCSCSMAANVELDTSLDSQFQVEITVASTSSTLRKRRMPEADLLLAEQYAQEDDQRLSQEISLPMLSRRFVRNNGVTSLNRSLIGTSSLATLFLCVISVEIRFSRFWLGVQ